MVDIEDDEKFQQLARTFSCAWYEGYDPVGMYIPPGTIQSVNKDGSINWLDPITKRAMLFHNVHFRNAFIVIQRDKGKFKLNENQ